MTRYQGQMIATADGLRASLEQVMDLSSFEHYKSEPDDVLAMNRRLVAARHEHKLALDALLTTTEAADDMGERSLLPLIVKATTALESCMDLTPEGTRALVRHINHLMGSEPCDVSLQGLVTMISPAFRILAAYRLDHTHPDHLEMLRTLLTDANAEVRHAARSTIRQNRAPWWYAWFRHDPARQDLTGHQEVCLDNIRQTFADNSKLSENLAEVTPWVLELPDALIIEFAAFTLVDRHLVLNHQPLAEGLLLCPAGLDVARTLLRGWSKQSECEEGVEIFAMVLNSLPREHRLRVCMSLLGHVRRAPLTERSNPNAFAALQAAVIARAWPGDADPAPLLDVIDQSPDDPESFDAAALRFAEVLPRLSSSVVPWERIIALPLHGFPGAWELAEHLVAELMASASPKKSGPLMMDLLTKGSDRAATWALERIIVDRCWDGPFERAVIHVLTEPRARRLMFDSSDVRRVMLPHLRKMLRSELCSFAEACAIMHTLRDTYNSFIPQVSDLVFKEMAPIFSYGDKPEGEPTAQMDPTPQEWASWRAMRGDADRDRAFWSAALTLLPKHDWAEADHNILDAAWEQRDDISALELAAALVARGREIDHKRLFLLVSASSGQVRRMLSAIVTHEI